MFVVPIQQVDDGSLASSGRSMMDEYQRTAGRLMGVSKMGVSQSGVYPRNGYLNMEHDD